MIGLLALDQVLRHIPGRMVHVPFESSIGNDLFNNDTTHPASFGIPPYVIAYSEGYRHCFSPDYCQSQVSRHPEQSAPASLQTESTSAKRHEFYYSEVAHEE